MIIYVDVNADPQQIARALRRELGSELCLQVGLELAERGRSRYRLLVVDGHEVREADHEHPDHDQRHHHRHAEELAAQPQAGEVR
jgi:hypothetical protein